MGSNLQIPLQVQTPQPESPLKTIGGLMQLRSAMTENALRAAQTQQAQQNTLDIQAQAQQRQRALADQQTIMKGMQDPDVNARVHTGDFSDFEGKVMPDTLQALQTKQAEYKKALLANTAEENKNRVEALGEIASTANGLKQTFVMPDGTFAQGFQDAYSGALQQLQKNGTFKRAGITTPPPATISDPSQLDSYLATVGGAQKAHEQVLGEQKTQAETNKAQQEAELSKAKTPGAQAESGLQQLQFQSASSITPDTIKKRAELLFNPDEYTDPNVKEQVLNEQRTAIQQATAAMPEGTKAVNAAFKDSSDRIGRLTASIAQGKATVGTKITVAAGTEAAKNAQSALTPEALDMAAELYRHTGTMPQLGMRNQQAMRQIFNRAAEMGPIDIGTERAAYDANKASLAGLVKNRDAVSAFENTANKNLDLLIQQGQKVVDSGSPWINSPLRNVDAKLLGGTEVPAYNAARQVAINEIAKVTSNPGLTGQLSDSARHEVEGFNPANATFAQTLKVAKVLRQDMANRHQAYNEQIDDISKRIGQGGTVQEGGGNATHPAATHRWNPTTGKIEPVGGGD